MRNVNKIFMYIAITMGISFITSSTSASTATARIGRGNVPRICDGRNIKFTSEIEAKILSRAQRALFIAKSQRKIVKYGMWAAMGMIFWRTDARRLEDLVSSNIFPSWLGSNHTRNRLAVLVGYILGNHYLAANIIGNPVSEILEDLGSLAGSVGKKVGAPSDGTGVNSVDAELEFYKTQQRLLAFKDRLTPYQIKVIAEKLAELKARYFSGHHYYDMSREVIPQLRKLDNIMLLPTCVLPIPPERRRKVQDLVKNFSPQIQYDIGLLTSSLINKSKLVGSNSNTALILVGRPGTGKTTFTKAFVREALGIPMITINLAGMKLSDIIGQQHYWGDSKSSGLSAMAHGFIHSKDKFGRKNKMSAIFLDEVDKVLNGQNPEVFTSFLLHLLDPNTTRLRVHDLGIDVDISNTLIILAGNALPKNEALLSRMKVLVFDGFGEHQRLSIAWNHFTKRMKEANIKVNEKRDFTVVKAMAKHDINPGVRAILYVVDDYVNHLTAIANKWVKKGQPFDYKTTFKRYTPREEYVEKIF